MSAETNPASPTKPRRRDFWVAFFCLVAALSLLFHKDFQPDQVLFANDGPLGANRAQSDYVLGNFQSFWMDLNWLGVASLGLVCDVSGFLMAALCVFSRDFGPVLFAKIFAPSGVFLLGLSAWVLFRQLRFRPWVCLLGALAAALNSMAFSAACWGLPTWTLCWTMNMFAIAALISPSIRNRTLKAILAGCAVGLGVMEGFDVGAIFSLFTAAFAFLSVIATERATAKTLTRGFATVAIMAVSAGVIAAQTVSGLIGTQVKGVVGMAQDEATKRQRWDEATRWSLPKAETLRFIIPGLFGYRMPELYGEPVQSVSGSNYWGSVGQAPGVIQSRHSGMGFYAGEIVALVAVFGIAQSFRKKGNAFAPTERKQLWCWFALLIVSLLLGWGRYAPFYRLVYALPYFSTIRNPFKFLFPFSMALLILFGYGLEALGRLYLDKAVAKGKDWREQLNAWWKTAPIFDKKWTIGSVAALAAGLLGLLIYAASKRDLVAYLQQAGFPDQQLADSIAQFSLQEVTVFILMLILSMGLLTLILSGVLSGLRAKWAVTALGVLMFLDLARADTPWIVYWNYKDKYASNPVIEFLRQQRYDGRVTAELAPMSRQWLINDRRSPLPPLYSEWLQHHFQYYRIQSLDIIQMPHLPEMESTYMRAFRSGDEAGWVWCGRLWQLTSTRYIIGMAGFLDLLNAKFDPGQKRFRIAQTFDIVPKPGVTEATNPDQLTAVLSTNGQFALFEFTGALPRAKLFVHWQVNTNDDATIEQLKSPAFDPAQTVLVANDLPGPNPATSTNQTSSAVELAHYEPKRIQFNADATAPSVLLLNDRFNPDWRVSVDGKPEALLRCNFIMRGVYLTPGKHRVEFRFRQPLTPFYISLAGLAAGVILCGYLVVTRNSAQNSGCPEDAGGPRSENRPSQIASRKSK
jgi:hypothetical protein